MALQKENFDPRELDEFVVRPSLRSKTTPEMLEVLGMETEMKEKRFLDRRPK